MRLPLEIDNDDDDDDDEPPIAVAKYKLVQLAAFELIKWRGFVRRVCAIEQTSEHLFARSFTFIESLLRAWIEA